LVFNLREGSVCLITHFIKQKIFHKGSRWRGTSSTKACLYEVKFNAFARVI
jgi:hypothetical protein